MPGGTNQRGSNLTQADRERGGRASASRQVRDARGQFAGTAGKVKAKESATMTAAKPAVQEHRPPTEYQPSTGLPDGGPSVPLGATQPPRPGDGRAAEGTAQ